MDPEPEKSDADLLGEFNAGRRAALGELAARHESSMLGLAAGMLGGQRELACDAVQETWLRVIRFGGAFNGRSSVKTWLYRVLLNRCRDLAAERVRLSGEQGANEKLRVEDGHAERGSAASAEDAEVLRQAVGRLSAEQQAVVLLCYHEGTTHEDAADVLEIPVGTLKSRLHAALERLRTELRGGDPL